MIKLEKEFVGVGEVKGFKFKMLFENEKAFMYEVSYQNEDGYTSKWYEVFERKVSKATDTIMNGVMVHFDEREVYPRSNSFGVWAWCINNYDIAKAKFDYVSTRVKKVREQTVLNKG